MNSSIPRSMDRSPSKPPGNSLRRFFGVVALVGAVLLMAGSWTPFKTKPVAWADAVTHFKRAMTAPVGEAGRIDLVVNVAVMIPIAFAAMGGLLAASLAAPIKRSAPGKLLMASFLSSVVLCGCVALALMCEFGQLWIPRRVPALSDVVAQGLGAVLGIAGWWLIGSRFSGWLRSAGSPGDGRTTGDWLLEAYALGLLLYQLLPFDLIWSPAELWHKLQSGRIRPVPFTGISWSGQQIWQWTVDAALYVPVGALAWRWFARRGRPGGLAAATLLGALFVSAVEITQVFLSSRFAETTDVLIGTLGCLVGAAVMSALSAPVLLPQPDRRNAANKWILAGLSYACLLTAVFCWPFHLVSSGAALRQRLGGFFSPPFSRLLAGPSANIGFEVARKLGWFAPLGLMWGLAAIRWVSESNVTRRQRSLEIQELHRWIAPLTACGAAAAVAVGIEVMQCALLDHSGDATDALLCATGAALGVAAAGLLVRSDARRNTPT